MEFREFKVWVRRDDLIQYLKDGTLIALAPFAFFAVLILSTLVITFQFLGLNAIPLYTIILAIAYVVAWFLTFFEFLKCLANGHRPWWTLRQVSGFDGEEIAFEDSCRECRIPLNVSARYNVIKLPPREDSVTYRVEELVVPDDVEREARLAIADTIREGGVPPEGALRVYALYFMTRQVHALIDLGLWIRRVFKRHQAATKIPLAEVLKEVGVKLDFNVSEKGIFQLRLRGDCLYVEAPSLLSYLWKERGVGLDIIEFKVVEVLKNQHANKIIALIQLLGRPLPKSDPIILDTVMIGRDETGPWLLRAPPTFWHSSLEEQLSWTSGFTRPRRKGVIEA